MKAPKEARRSRGRPATGQTPKRYFRMDDESWYLGTADAVYQNLDILRSHNPEYILVLAGDHIYKMDYANLIADHVEQIGRASCRVRV